MKKTLILLIISLLIQPLVMADDTCSRVAVVNHQEILIDSNSQQKGENLRYFLEKDPVALSYLEKYREGGQIKWYNAALGTTGTALIVAGLINDENKDQRNFFLIGGAATILINYFISRTVAQQNETYLNKAIEEYNKRNLPRIDFQPLGLKSMKPEIYIGGTWDF